MKGLEIWRLARAVIVTVLGGVLLVAGGIMLVTPGPGLLAIVAGLALLSTEYDWAHDLRIRAHRRLRQAREAAAEPVDNPELTRHQIKSREHAA